MKILAPAVCADDILPLCEAGADAFFCGLQLESDYIRGISSGRRSRLTANFGSWKDLCRAIELAHGRGKKISLALNAHHYPPEFYSRLSRMALRGLKSGVDGIIVADMALLLHLREVVPHDVLIASTGMNIFNAKTVAFLNELGVGHMVLPRQLSIREIKDLTDAFPSVRFECFAYGSCCLYIDGYCEFLHGRSGPGQAPCTSLSFDKKALRNVSDDFCRSFLAQKEHQRQKLFGACAACSLWDLKDANISFLKILDRSSTLDERIRRVTFFREILTVLNSGKIKGRKTFSAFVRECHVQVFRHPCRNLCYYQNGI